MSCSVIIQDMYGQERRVYVDSEEELKNMTVEEFIRRVCPEDERRGRCLYFIIKELEDDQTPGDCGIKHESVHEFEPGCSGGTSKSEMHRSTRQGSESVDFPHDRPGSVTDWLDLSVSFPIPRSTVTEFLNYNQTLGYYGIRKGSAVIEMEFPCVGSAGFPSPEDEDKGVPRTDSMEILADMQQPQ